MNLIVAVDKNWGIGKNGTMPWHISADLKYFKEKTTGKTVIMGRKTLLSFPKQKPLPNRKNLVLSRDTAFNPEGVCMLRSLDEAKKYAECPDVFVIGGGSVYKALLPHCKYAYVTKIDAEYECDTYFENLDTLNGWHMCECGDLMHENGIGFRFTVYENLGAADLEEDKTMIDYNKENMPPMDEVDFNKLEFLCEVDNDFEADVKISLLRSCGILAYKRYSQYGAVAKIYCGSSNLGVMIYVPKDNLEESREILDAPFDTSELEQD